MKRLQLRCSNERWCKLLVCDLKPVKGEGIGDDDDIILDSET